MEARTRDSAPEESVSKRRFPLSIVVFRQLTYVPDLKTALTTFETGGSRYDNGVTWVAPQAWFDPDLRTVVIKNRHYPLESVHYFERARYALTRPAEPRPPSDYDYVIGKKAIRNAESRTKESGHPEQSGGVESGHVAPAVK